MENEAQSALEQFKTAALQEIENERSERIETQQALKKLWDQTCQRIEDARSF